MRGRPFSRSLAHALGFAVMLAAPPATALGIEFEPLSELFVDANDTSIDTLGLPIVGPFVDSHTVSADGATSSASYDFSDERLRIEFDATRPGSDGLVYSLAQGLFWFTVDSDVDYQIDGGYSATDAEGRLVFLWVTFEDVTDPLPGQDRLLLFENEQHSRATPNESFALGGTGGDFDNELSGSTSGSLLAGHEYRVFYLAAIDDFPLPAVQPASASGYFQLSFIPEPSTSLLLAVGLLALAVWRR